MEKPSNGNSAAALLWRRRNSRDEFYTLYEDIHKEIFSYPPEVWAGKAVYCPADSETSNFYKFFLQNFTHLKLKSLTCSSIQGKYCIITNPLKAVKWKKMDEDVFFPNGDFRSLQAKKLMEACDIVVTNPPFSLTLPFIQQIVGYGKQFLVISYLAQLNSVPVFREIMRGNLTLGNSNKEGHMIFQLGDNYEGIGTTKVLEDGTKIARVAADWFTNLPINERHLPENNPENLNEYLSQFKRFEKFPKVINFNKTRHVPTNYFGVMGVPVTYMRWHNPDEYIIHGRNGFNGGQSAGLKIQGEDKVSFGRIFIQRKKD